MKKRALVYVLVISCAGLIGLFLNLNLGSNAQASSVATDNYAYLTIDKNFISTSAERGSKEVEVAEITFRNTSNKDINVEVPRLDVGANDTSFSVRDNIDGAHLYYDNGFTLDVRKYDISNGHTLTFNTSLPVPANSMTVATIKIDVSETAKVQTLGFDLDFLSPDSVIKYFNPDKSNYYNALAPFTLSGNAYSTVCIDKVEGDCPTVAYRLTNNDYDLHLKSMDGQNNGYDGPLYSPYIPEGGMIRAWGDADVYIVKYSHGKRFKRLILSPSVFKSYGHLKWEDVKNVDKVVLDSYITSDYVYVAGDSTIWRLDPQGDVGTRRKFLAPDVSSWNYDPDGVYEINTTDRNSYIQGSDIVN